MSRPRISPPKPVPDPAVAVAGGPRLAPAPAVEGALAVALAPSYSSIREQATVWHLDGRAWSIDPDGPKAVRVLWQGAAPELWAAGEGGAIWRRVRGKWLVLVAGKPSPEPHAYAISSDGADGVWIVGTTLKRCRAGKCVTWESQIPSNIFPLVSVWSTSARNAYAVMGATGLTTDSQQRVGTDLGPSPALTAWDGKTWKAIDTEGMPWLAAVTATGPDDVWALGWNGLVLHFDGKRWETSAVRELSSPTHIFALDKVVRVVGENGKVLRLSR